MIRKGALRNVHKPVTQVLFWLWFFLSEQSEHNTEQQEQSIMDYKYTGLTNIYIWKCSKELHEKTLSCHIILPQTPRGTKFLKCF